jgi:hypothetical protein
VERVCPNSRLRHQPSKVWNVLRKIEASRATTPSVTPSMAYPLVTPEGSFALTPGEKADLLVSHYANISSHPPAPQTPEETQVEREVDEFMSGPACPAPPQDVPFSLHPVSETSSGRLPRHPAVPRR